MASQLQPHHGLPVLYVTGTHYHVGSETGRTFRSHIQTYCDQSSALNDVLLPYYRSNEGREVYEEYHAAMREVYPQYEDELRGIADSSGVEYYKIFLLHVSSEMLGLLGKQASTPGGCSDLMLNYLDSDGRQHSIMAHNEDGDTLIASLVYVVCAHVIPDREKYPNLPEEHLVAYTYPGRLMGNCVSANHHGLTYSINILFPKNVIRKKTAYYTLTRALASAQSLEQALATIADDPLGCGYGFSVNLAQRRENSSEVIMMNIEVAPRTGETAAYDVKTMPVSADLERGLASHFNMYQRLTDVDQHEDQSSIQRQQTLYDQGQLPNDLQSLLAFLGNQNHPVYPVYRNGKPPDTMATFATGVFDLVEGTFSIYVGNPACGMEPVVSFPVAQRATAGSAQDSAKKSP